MKKNHSLEKIASAKFLGVVLSGLGVFCVVSGIVGAIQNKLLDWQVILIIVVGGYFIFWAIGNYMEISQEYKVDAKGITRKILNRSMQYVWEEVNDISICDIGHKGFEIMIRISVGKEKKGPLSGNRYINPLSGYELWRDESYAVYHINKVIMLDYEKEKYDEIKRICCREIIDRRTNRGKSQKIEF